MNLGFSHVSNHIPTSKKVEMIQLVIGAVERPALLKSRILNNVLSVASGRRDGASQ